MFLRSLLISATLAFALPAVACTGISLTTTNNNYVQARTIEWGKNNLNSKLVVSPRNYSFTSIMPNQEKGMTWDSRYGFVGLSVHDDKIIGEGMNEKGLNAGVFFFDGYGSLAPFDPSAQARKTTVTDMDFVRWMLSQFATVDEVLAAFKNITLAPIMIENGHPSPTGHWRVADKSGRNVVIEITNQGKEIKIHDNKVGVLTNSPTFDWHLTNLKNYINLEPGTVPPIKEGDMIFKSLGAGTGFLGLPGDITPPSRFVRAAFFVNTVQELKDSESAVSEAFHILNNFDIPIGTEFNKAHRKYMPKIPTATQWTAVSDLNNNYFYYTSMYNSQIRRVDLANTAFNFKKEIARPIDNGKFSFVDVIANK